MVQKHDLQSDYSSQEGFEMVYRHTWKKLYNICFHHTQNTFVAEELVQEIFKSLWERRFQLSIEGPIENYLSRAARLKVAEYHRNQVTREKHVQQASSQCSTQGNYTEQQVEFSFLKKELIVLVDQLPEQCRKVYRMSREEGFNNKEIASSLTISEKTVENQITKALHFLRKNLSVFKFS